MKNNNFLPVKKQEENLSPAVEAFQPKVVVEQAHEAAKALKEVLDAKTKKVIVNGERYLEFEDWQLLGRFYGYTIETGEAEEIWREGKLVGFKARATVYHNGTKVGGAEASCLRDEKNWTDKPEFQLKSMAQTRAGAKALRNVLAWVAVLAGYRPTPAEEIVSEENGNNHEKCPYCGTVGKFHKKGCPAGLS